MNFHSITSKFLAFLLFLVFGISTGVFVLFSAKQSIPLSIVLLLLFFLSASILGFFLVTITTPLSRIIREIKNLLTGKKYHRIEPSTSDEIGIVSHFFNKITLNLESISSDIVETKRLSSELDVARKIQKDIFPEKAPSIMGLDMVARSRPAVEVGGDSFDFIKQEYHTMVYIGDATGHGLPAGIVMMIVNTLIRAFARYGMLPYEILIQVNAILYERISAAQFMSLVMLRWDERRQRMFYIGAGHEYILVYRAAEKTVEKIKTGGIALRMTPNIKDFIEEKDLNLTDGDVVVLYSDGVSEGKSPDGEMYGVEKLASSLQKHGHRDSAEKIFDALTQDFSKFMADYSQQRDDITMIVARKLPPGAEVPTPIKLNIGGLEETSANQAHWEWEKDQENR